MSSIKYNRQYNQITIYKKEYSSRKLFDIIKDVANEENFNFIKTKNESFKDYILRKQLSRSYDIRNMIKNDSLSINEKINKWNGIVKIIRKELPELNKEFNDLEWQPSDIYFQSPNPKNYSFIQNVYNYFLNYFIK